MELINNGVLFITISSEAKSAIMHDAESWAAKLKEEIEAEDKSKQEKQRSVQMQRDIIAERMPQVWQRLLASIDSHVNAFNAKVNPKRKLACHRLVNNEITVRPDAMTTEVLFARFSPMDHSIAVRSGGHGDSFKPEVQMTGSGEVILRDTYNVYRENEMDQIASYALERGIKPIFHALDTP